jgi:hypothetical protein
MFATCNFLVQLAKMHAKCKINAFLALLALLPNERSKIHALLAFLALLALLQILRSRLG